MTGGFPVLPLSFSLPLLYSGSDIAGDRQTGDTETEGDTPSQTLRLTDQ